MLGIKITMLIISLFLSAFFSGVETAFVSLSRIRLQHLSEKKKKGIDLVKKLRDNNQRLIITVLIGNNIVNIFASAVATAVAIEIFPSNGIGIAVGIMTLLILIFGEITPKTIALAKNEWIAIHSAPILRLMQIIFLPIIMLLEKQTEFLSGPFRGKKRPVITEEEIMSVVNLGKEVGEVKEDEKEMIHNIFRFGDLTAYEVMVPRTQLFSLQEDEKLRDVMEKIIQNGFSRIPVYKDTIDNITGVLFVKDALVALNDSKEEIRLKKIIRQPLFVPEQMLLEDVLKKLKKKKTHMALVVDEHGGVSGLITIEDLVEEIVGDIFDETDKQEILIKKITQKRFMVKGETEIETVNHSLGIDVSLTEDYETISGLILHELKHMPEVGEILELKKIKIIVRKVSQQRIQEVEIEKK
jgi:putative hemolysin